MQLDARVDAARTDLEERLQRYLSEDDVRFILRAFHFGRLAHGEQRRASGEPYICHPCAVAAILAELQMDAVILAAAILHDVIEDTETSFDDVQREFGDEVAELVDGVTKLSRLQFRTQVEEQAENLRKMLLAMAKDIRVILIKLADRLHNMRTLGSLPPAKQQEIARETLEIFAPLAHRLGIFRVKWELEDLSLRYLQPEIYRDLSQRIPHRRLEREAIAQSIIQVLQDRMREFGIEAEIHGRAKHFYSIYQKMYSQGRDLSQMYDLMAVRVIVESVKDCYGVLGIVHTLWKPIPGRFKDYIATPKSNMYQSLHTTVVGPQGEPFEIQIRTRDMHRTAEYGIAAHWRYKEGGRYKDFDEKLAWLREVMEWQKDLRDASEFMESLKMDVFSDEVFVFTPKGDVIDLPSNSTPIDFAYRIHTEIGHHCVGAKVNGRIVSLDTPLKNGDIVEVLTSNQSPGPSADWLQIVQTSGARNRIRQWFKRERREENLERGKDAVERELRHQGIDSDVLTREDWLEEIRKRFSLQNVEDLWISVGYGGLTALQVVNRLADLQRRERKEKVPSLPTKRPERSTDPHREDGIRVRGIENVLVRFSQCCNPVPGDAIVGYVTRGRGVSIHRTNCPNLAHHGSERERMIEVTWDEVDAAFYPVEIAVHGLDRPGLLSDVARVLADSHTNIMFAKARGGRDKQAVIDLVVEIRSLDQLEHLRRKIEKIKDVFSVERVGKKPGA